MKLLTTWVALVHLLVLFSQVQAKWSRSKIGSKSRNDFQDLFDSVRRHEELNDEVSNSCDAQFGEYRGMILRTSDSMKNGAIFIKAIDSVTEEYCRDKCCHTKEKGKQCDLAVYRQQETDDDDDDDSPSCFLFSCVDNKGGDNCETAQNTGYKVFRRKKKDAVEDQLRQVFEDAAPTRSAAKQDSSDTCDDEFAIETGYIIKADDSIKNGALFFKESSTATSRSACHAQCCDMKPVESNRYCDFVVFLEKLNPKSSERKRRCFLFSCTDENDKFLCVTSHNNDYSVSTRKALSPEDMHHQNTTNDSSTKTAVLPTKSYTLAVPTTIATHANRKSSTTTSTSSSVASVANFKNEIALDCGRLMWRCDDGGCIKVTDVCNGVPNCKDDSDEVGCDVLDDIKTKTTTTASKTVTTTTTTLTSTTSPMTKKRSTETTTTTRLNATTSSQALPDSLPHDGQDMVVSRTEPQKGAVLPLALGLSVTACVILIVVCRLQVLKRKTRRRGKPLTMEESDYLINGMYL